MSKEEIAVKLTEIVYKNVTNSELTIRNLENIIFDTYEKYLIELEQLNKRKEINNE